MERNIEKILKKSGVSFSKEGKLYLVDTTKMTTSEWEMFRAYFCGGSDSGVIVSGNDKYTNKRELALKKRELLGTYKFPDNPLYKEEKTDTFMKAGHSLEDMVAKMYAKLSSKDVRVLPRMIINEDYPYIAVNFDRVIVDKNNNLSLLEIKTTTAEAEWNLWGSESKPIIPTNYMSQLSTYQLVGEHLFGDREATIVTFLVEPMMRVLAAECFPLDKSYSDEEIAGLIKNGFGKNLRVRKYPRDTVYEDIIAEEIEDFYKNYVEVANIPPLAGNNPSTDRRVLNCTTSESSTKIELSNSDVLQAVEDINTINAEVSKLKKQIENLTKQKANAENVIIQQLNGAISGRIINPTGTYYDFKYKGRKSRKVDYEGLSIAFPEAYQKYVQENVSAPSLSLKLRK